MIANLMSYPVMRDSGVPWLGEIPAHWELRRTKTLLRERAQKGFPDQPLLAATQTKGVVRKEQYENRTVLALKDLHLLKLVKPEDFVISLRSFQGGIEYAREQGIISPAYTILYPARPELHGYLAWLFKSQPYIKNLSLYVTGIRQGQNIDYERLARSTLPMPPIQEQADIVRFLDHADRRIRRYIRAKQKLINLLEEQKRAMINRAVSCGLAPLIRLKPSGMAWLGDVPEHWDVLQLGHFAAVGNGSTPSRGSSAYWSDGTFPWLNSSSVNAGVVTVSDQFVTEQALRECHLPRVPPDSVLIAITGQGKTRGRAAVLKIEATINQHIAFITLRKRQPTATALYLRHFLDAAYSELRRMSDDSGSTRGALTCGSLRHFRVVLPPSVEQEEIVRWVHTATARATSALRIAEREISLLREYRIRLIADVVTGKLDVREAAARLPFDAADDEPIDAEQLDAEETVDDSELSREVVEA